MDEDKYQISTLVGKGLSGGVYKATHSPLGREIALRRFYDYSGDTCSIRWENLFFSTAHALKNIKHPNVIEIIDFGVDDDGAYLVTPLSEGETVRTVMARRPFDEVSAKDMASQLLEAFSAIHEAGVIHGVLTPSSVFLEQDRMRR